MCLSVDGVSVFEVPIQVKQCMGFYKTIYRLCSNRDCHTAHTSTTTVGNDD